MLSLRRSPDDSPIMILPRIYANNDVVPIPTPQSDLTFWCEAAVRDRLTAFYHIEMCDSAKASQASRLHWSIWRSYLNDLSLQARASRQALTNLLVDFGLNKKVINAGDEIVIDEITDLILQRFRRTPFRAKTYAKCLLVAATRMGQSRN